MSSATLVDGATLAVEDPSTGATIAHVPRGGAHDVDIAVAAARACVADRVDAGYVMVNEYFGGGVAVPFGGTGLSGTGRERGLIALDSYLRNKTVVVRVGRRGGS